MIRFEDLLEKVRAYTPDADVELLRRAYVFSAFEHRGQVRHSGEPYLIHPLAVADFLADMKLDVVAIAARPPSSYAPTAPLHATLTVRGSFDVFTNVSTYRR